MAPPTLLRFDIHHETSASQWQTASRSSKTVSTTYAIHPAQASRRALTAPKFLTLCYAGLIYNYRHHPYAEIENQPNQAPPTVSASDPDPPTAPATTPAPLTNGNSKQSQSQSQSQQATSKDQDDKKDDEPKKILPSDKPHSRAEHTVSLRELAQSLVLKEQQIEYLIQSLPGIGSSERDQERRIRELQEELRVVEAERKEKEVVRENLVEGLGKVLVGVRRVP